MAITTSLADWIRVNLDEINPTDEIINDDTLAQILLNHRIRSYNRAYGMCNSDDSRFRVDSSTAQVTITMTDLDGSKDRYGHDYTYYFHDDAGFKVEVDDVEIDDHSYDFTPMSLDLLFHTARTESSPVVKVTGHLVDWDGAAREAGLMLATRLSRLSSVTRGEYEWLSRRLVTMVNRRWGPRVIKRRKRQ